MVHDMQWWNDFTNWLGSDDGWRVLTAAVFPFLAILVAGILGALIGRGATRRLISHQDRELQSAAIAAMIESGRSATMWSSLASGAQAHSDSQFNAADIRIRLLPLSGASAAADWATHEIRAMRRDSAGFSFQADQTFADYRDRLLEWQRRPGRARKLFALDLERFRFEDSSADSELVEQQRRWALEQAAAEQAAVTTDEPVAAPTSVVTTPAVETTPVPAEPTPATQAYAMPVAASEPANDAESDEASEPHVESEEDPEDEFDGVAIAEPVAHDEPTGYVEPAASDESTDSEETAGSDDTTDDHESTDNDEPTGYAATREWEGQPTQAMPLVEPANPYASSNSNTNTDEHRAL
jgi:hypothetical protein